MFLCTDENLETRVYPNPFKNILHLSLQESHEFKIVQLIDLQGRILITKDVFGTSELVISPEGVSMVYIL